MALIEPHKRSFLMALADITLNDGQTTPVAHVFTYITTQNGRVVRSDLTRTPDLPLLLTHAHTSSVKSGVKTDSHLLRVDDTRMDADGITPIPVNIRVMADIPKNIYSDGLADDLAAYIRNWATSANVRAWLRGSVG
jgi:hypothetical protein